MHVVIGVSTSKTSRYLFAAGNSVLRLLSDLAVTHTKHGGIVDDLTLQAGYRATIIRTVANTQWSAVLQRSSNNINGLTERTGGVTTEEGRTTFILLRVILLRSRHVVVVGVGVALQNNMRFGNTEKLGSILAVLHTYRTGELTGHTQQVVVTEAHNLHRILFLNDRSIFCREENTLRLLATRLRGARSEHQSTQNRGATRAFLINSPTTTAVLSGTGTKRSTQEALAGALIMAATGVLGIHVHTREIEVRNTRIQTLTHRSTRALELRTHSISLLLTLNLHILELVISGTLTRPQPSIRGNITSISICKRRNETITATGNIAINTMILSLQQILRITLVITRNQSILRGQRRRMNRIPVQHRTSLTVALQTQSHIGRIGTAGQLRTQLGRIQIKRLAGTVSTNTGQLRRRNRQVTRCQILGRLADCLQRTVHLGIEGVLMETQSRNVVQALVRNATRSRMSVGRGNHNVRLVVRGAKLCTDALHQFITQRLPTGQRVQNNDEVALTRGAIHRNKSTSILASMHTATLLGRVTIAHEADFTGLTGNIRRTRTHQVGGGARALRSRGCGRNLTGRKNCGSHNKACCTNASKRVGGCLKTRKNRGALLLPCRQGGILFRHLRSRCSGRQSGTLIRHPSGREWSDMHAFKNRT